MLVVEIKFHIQTILGVAGQVQKILYTALLFLGVKQIAAALALGAAGAADAVGVMFVLAGHIIVHHGIHIRNINAAGRHIRGHQHGDLPFAEASHNAVALGLA